MNKEKLIDQACLKLAEVLKEKNRKYGSSFDQSVNEYGKIAICLRLGDKLNRAKQIIKGEPATADESLIDTFLDGAGYNILAVIYLEEELSRSNIQNDLAIKEKEILHSLLDINEDSRRNYF